MLLGFVFVVMGITVYQERKTERALEALRDLSSPRARVIRGGEQTAYIPGREVVRGDIVLVAEGDRVPADAVLVSRARTCRPTSRCSPASRCRCASWPPSNARRPRRPAAAARRRRSAQHLRGHACGAGSGRRPSDRDRAAARRWAASAWRSKHTEREPTQLQRHSARLVRNMALVGLFVCVLVVLIYGLTRGHWIEGLLAGLTLAMATLPEEIPVVLTVFLALGAWRISQKNVLTRRIPAVESLGSATVLCVDKTGTLTLNRMTIARLFAAGASSRCRRSPRWRSRTRREHCRSGACLPWTRLPTRPSTSWWSTGSWPANSIRSTPWRRRSRVWASGTSQDTEHLHDDWALVHEYPLSRELLAMSHVWQSPAGDAYVIAAKGAPEAIADLCHWMKRSWRRLSRAIDAMAEDGLGSWA